MRRRVWVVGSAGAGKKSLATALGGVAKRATGELEWAAARATIALCSDAERWRGECERGDVVVLVYDLTDHATFDAVARNWAKLVSAQTRTLLVGTRLDCAAARREVATSEAMELALVECDDCVEVCATKPPFEGVVYARQLLTTWLTQDNQHQESPSKAKLGARSSVWLYDPTEEAALSAHDDVKLRPISRALFEMREAGSDRVKLQERRREQAVTKLVTRSRYHGPTESSRSMRWQAHQLQLQQQNARLASRRKSVAGIDLSLEHAKLETKSFLQPTKLMKQRVEEIKHKLMETTKPPPSRSSLCEETKPKARKSRQRAMSTAPSLLPPAPVLKAHTRPRAPSLSPPRAARSRPSFTQLAEIESDEFNLDLVSSPLAPLMLPPSPVSQPRSLPKENQPPPPEATPMIASDKTKQDQPDEATHNENAFQSTEIDDMLDYFDGVTLPI